MHIDQLFLFPVFFIYLILLMGGGGGGRRERELIKGIFDKTGLMLYMYTT